MAKRDFNDPKWRIPSWKRQTNLTCSFAKKHKGFDTPHLDIKLSSTFVLIKTSWNQTSIKQSLQIVSPPNMEWIWQDGFANRVLPTECRTLKTSSSQASAEVKRCWGSTLDGWRKTETWKHYGSVAMMCCFQWEFFSFLFLVASWSFIDPHKGQNRLKGSVNDLVGKVALWNSILSFLLPGTWQHTKWFGSCTVPRIWKIQIALPLWEKAPHPVPRYVHQIPPSHQWVGMRWGPWNFHIWCIAQVIQVIKTFPNFTLDKVFLDVW